MMECGAQDKTNITLTQPIFKKQNNMYTIFMLIKDDFPQNSTFQVKKRKTF